MKYFLYCRKSQEDDERQALSIPTQTAEAERVFRACDGVEIAETFAEARSAKTPGRSVFNEMLARVEKGEADGIVAWAPDRLARNSVDSGRIVHMLDTGALKDLKFVSYPFENSANGKFMLLVMFAQSKQYSDVLSDRVVLGMEMKIEKLGIRPNRAPEGYLNVVDEKRQKIIVPDPERFPLIRGIVDRVLAGTHSPAQATKLVNEEWGYLTRKTSRQGGRPLALSTTYKILGNPFYAGLIRWNGQLHPGSHTPLLSLDEFEALQHRLGRVEPARPKKHIFAFTGLMRCGGCGLMITAEQKTKPSGRSYIHYHCTRRGLGPRCPERSVERRSLEAQIIQFLETLAIDPWFERWAVEELEQDRARRTALEEARLRALRRKLEETRAQITELKSLRLRRLLSDEEFVADRQRLETECLNITQKLDASGKDGDRFGPVRDAILMRNQAVSWFQRGGDAEKRLIFKTTGSDPTLKGKMLRVEAAKPFVQVHGMPEILPMCGSVEDARTNDNTAQAGHQTSCPPELKLLIWQFIKDTQAGLDDPSFAYIAPGLTELRKRFGWEERDQAA